MWKCRCGGDNPDSTNSCQSCGSSKLSSQSSKSRLTDAANMQRERIAKEQMEKWSLVGNDVNRIR